MTASLAELKIEGGIAAFKCPITGMDITTQDEGFDSSAHHSPHLRFFVDWIGGIWAANPQDLPVEQEKYQKELISIFKNEGLYESQNDMIARCAIALPESVLILEILNPPIGSFDGDICYTCIEFGKPALAPKIQLQEVF